ncbi:uncharacterized protein LOC117298794 [Asterias rubens]|uniref:uncharacterized protein LOC117298794 n=1 Tax=Asterias rubens TaxID=7604 RepID=UPI001455B53E|nr:uncharacterized protein LOC117298794 [Asterias rubens]
MPLYTCPVSSVMNSQYNSMQVGTGHPFSHPTPSLKSSPVDIPEGSKVGHGREFFCFNEDVRQAVSCPSAFQPVCAYKKAERDKLNQTPLSDQPKMSANSPSNRNLIGRPVSPQTVSVRTIPPGVNFQSHGRVTLPLSDKPESSSKPSWIRTRQQRDRSPSVDSRHLLNSYKQPSPNRSLSSDPACPVTVRPVSPGILSLCNKFAPVKSTSDFNLDIPKGRPRSKSATGAMIKKPDSPVSPLLLRRSVSPKPTKLLLATDSSDSESGQSLNLARNLLSPGNSPSSGYGSGFYSSSPLCLSPRSNSPALVVDVTHNSDKTSHGHLTLPDADGSRAVRTSSQDSGVANISESGLQYGQAPSSGTMSPPETVLSLAVPMNNRPKTLVRSNNVFESIDQRDSKSFREPSPQSPDEGFQDSDKSNAFDPSVAPLSRDNNKPNQEVKKSKLTIRLKSPGSSLDQPPSPDPPKNIPEITLPVNSRPFLTVEERRRDFGNRSDTLMSSVQSFECLPSVVVSDHCDEEVSNISWDGSMDASVFTPKEPSQIGLSIDDIKRSKSIRKLSNASTLSSFSHDSLDDELSDDMCFKEEPKKGDQCAITLKWERHRDFTPASYLVAGSRFCNCGSSGNAAY